MTAAVHEQQPAPAPAGPWTTLGPAPDSAAPSAPASISASRTAARSVTAVARYGSWRRSCIPGPTRSERPSE